MSYAMHTHMQRTCTMMDVYPFSVAVMKHTISELPTLSKLG